ELRPLARTAAIAAPVAIAIGLLFLLVDLGKPFRAFRLFMSFNPRSALSWGVWFLNIFFMFSLLRAWQVLKGKVDAAGKLGWVGGIFAVLVGSYTGVLLMQSPGRPLWDTPAVPLLFLNGALISGIALALLASGSRVAATARTKVGKWLAGLLVLELALVAVELIALFNAGGESAAAAKGLFGGVYGFLFLAVEIGLGAILPVCILLAGRKSAAAHAVASVLILLGIFAMRFVVVIGGQMIN
ncbi:hypothetical protein LCGC14_1104530, partial [marine sediment metagenome]